MIGFKSLERDAVEKPVPLFLMPISEIGRSCFVLEQCAIDHDRFGAPQAEIVIESLHADVVIVGAGLAGTLAALILTRSGMRVAIIDRHATYPNEFRCEKLSPIQVALMQDLGVLDCLSGVTHKFNRIHVIRGGGSAAIQHQDERGLTYSDMVNTFRENWPASVTFFEGRVVNVATSPDRQHVTLADGREISAKLVVVATGPGDKLPIKLGFKRHIRRRAHCICLGFNIAPKGNADFPFESMTYFGEHAGDRIGYATFFPTGQGMRVNMFSYHGKHENWIRAFQQDPIGKLHEIMPGIAAHLGDFELTAPLDIRPIDLYRTQNCRRDGMVLIGDAFQSSCPATGLGVTRLLIDVRQLCLVHVPHWFAAEGMEAAKIDSFYKDPLKKSCDSRSVRAAERGRRLAVETGARWRLERVLLVLASRFPILRAMASRWRGDPALIRNTSDTMT